MVSDSQRRGILIGLAGGTGAGFALFRLATDPVQPLSNKSGARASMANDAQPCQTTRFSRGRSIAIACATACTDIRIDL